ncbi:expressed unknown protein [Seminavis robusta]|uniref:Uncharacterized protein n=1 Tax=Seminavis robusta TaxID=568900 RepID=A0A9N8EMI1_9STRA|nr:expressed unknown protein [Seminavis robusta]|eukprot:Sro1229_g254471.1  (275) ;mRNA; f:23559-24383
MEATRGQAFKKAKEESKFRSMVFKIQITSTGSRTSTVDYLVHLVPPTGMSTNSRLPWLELILFVAADPSRLLQLASRCPPRLYPLDCCSSIIGSCYLNMPYYDSYDADITMTMCHDCDDQFYLTDDGEWNVCGECEGTLCSTCANRFCCSVCDVDGYPREGYCLTQAAASCKSCLAYCEDCHEVFHDCCKAEHLAKCNSKTRAQRAASAAAQRVTDTEKVLKVAEGHLKNWQQKVSRFTNELQAAREDKKKADRELAKENSKKLIHRKPQKLLV